MNSGFTCFMSSNGDVIASVAGHQHNGGVSKASYNLHAPDFVTVLMGRMSGRPTILKQGAITAQGARKMVCRLFHDLQRSRETFSYSYM
jgi:hypothetical protein